MSYTSGASNYFDHQQGWQTAIVGEWNIKPKEAPPMKTLYQVLVVHNDKVAIDTKAVAKDVEDAKFKSGAYGWLINERLTPGDVTIIVNALGRVEGECRPSGNA